MWSDWPMFNYKIHIIFLLIILVFSINVMAQNNKFVGNWDGAILVNEQKLNINVTFEMTGNNLIGTIDIPEQNIFDYPLEIENIKGRNIIFQMNNVPGNPVFEGLLEDNQIKGVFKQNNNKLDFSLTKAKVTDKNAVDEIKLKGTEKKVEIPVEGGKLYGSLTFPKVHDINDPIAIIIAGSGPTNRNGNSSLIKGKINNLKDIAYYLSNNSILTLRFDKRGVGASSSLVDKKTPTFTQYSQDIINIIEYINNNLGRENDQIFLIGHSEGGTLSIMTANEVNNLAGLILLASPGYKQSTLLYNQLERQNQRLYQKGKLESPDILTEALDELIEAIENNEEFDIENYNIPTNFKNAYMSLNKQRDFAREWLKTDPAQLLSQINIPTSIIQGSNDQQVSKGDSLRLSKAVKDEIETYKYIDGLNHLLFKDSHQVDNEVLETVLQFINQYK